jgi:Pro-kumamolisin, activation domain/FG-GAP-like repeat
MITKLYSTAILLSALSLIITTERAADAQIPAARPLITQSVSSALTVLAGNTRPEVRNATNDLGVAPVNQQIPHMMLQLRRPAEQEQALDALITELHDPQSPNYQRWLTPSEIGAQFGPAQSDIQAISNWLQQQGFTINSVYANRMVIDYSGTVAQVQTAFHTEIHNFNVNGVTRFANTSDPSIPAALAPAVVGVASLNDFPPKRLMRLQHAEYTNGTFSCGVAFMFPCNLLTPPDLATIYNFNPVFNTGDVGQGQTIYLIEDTNLFTNNDWTTFRSTFGIPASSYPTASLTTIHPGNCANQTNGDDGEAILDAEYASAGAPGAAIVIASCTNLLLAIQNVVNGANPPGIMSISYGECEASLGSTNAQAFSTAYQTGVAGGMSIFVSAGDGGAAGCDNHDTAEASSFGIAANGFASTVYNVAVGGTDFGDNSLGVNSTYWNPTNTVTFGSAKSYIPEIPWNDSCGSQLFATFFSFTTTYGSTGLCNSSTASSDGLLQIGGGSGAPSIMWSKPSWQTLLGNPADGVRDLPDVSLFSGGSWGHFYIFCYSDTANGGTPCTGDPITWSGAGGTSFAAPIWAGIQALINQQAGAKQGLPTFRLYQLAAKEYGSGGSSACNATNGNAVGSSCIFYDVTRGDMDVPCFSGTPNCYDPSGSFGVLSTSTSSYLPAFKSQTGWDFATGIGTVNVANLVSGWKSKTTPHDFNADGKSDIAWRDGSGDIAFWLMNGAAVSSTGGVGGVPSTWSIVGQRDFSGDGKADLLWLDTSGNIAMWFMNGAAVGSTAIVAQIPTTWSVAGVADFNGDGLGDILWHDTSGNYAVWLMNGATVTASAGLGNVSLTTWSVAGTGDFNGDGKADILWRDTSGDVTIWFMNGTAVASTAPVGTVAGWSIVGTGDFNGDGKSDIVWRDAAGDAAIWLMNGAAVSSAGGLGNVPTTWSIVQTGDYNGDGKSDLLWYMSGNTAIWFMNGVTLSSTGTVGNISTVWTVQGKNVD